MDKLTIHIFYSPMNEGWNFDIYDQDTRDVLDDIDSLDGGLCTGSLQDALGMAYEQARDLINKKGEL